MMTIYEAIEDLTFYMESKNRSAGTIRNLTACLKFFANYMCEYHNLEQVHLIRSTHLMDYQLHVSGQTNDKGESWTPTYVNVHLWAVRSLLKHLYKFSLMSVDLSKGVEDVATPEVLPKNVMSYEEFKKFLSVIDKQTDCGYRSYVLYSLIGSSGIRVSECSMLDISDVNLKERTLFIRHGKGDKERLAIFSEQVRDLLQNYLTAIRPMWKGADESNALFLGQKGVRFGIKGIETAMKNYIKLADLDTRLTPHSLRKMLTTELVKSNANPYHIKNICGWASLAPMKHYAKVSVDDIRRTLQECSPL
jgi:integrase/recombinase XerD